MPSTSVQNSIYKTRFTFLSRFTNTFKNPPKNPANKPGYQLVFSDEFSSPVDWNKWDWKEHWGNYSPGWKCIFKQSQVRQANGELSLVTEAQTVPNEPGAKSGKLCSHKSFNQQYGFFEARIKVPPKGVTNWPAFWLASKEKWPPEIDIFELMGDDSSYFTCTYHWNDDTVNAAAIQTILNQIKTQYGYQATNIDDAIRYLRIDWTQAKQTLIDQLIALRVHRQEGSRFNLPGSDTLSYAFHTFAINWEPGKITWLLDNVEIYCATENLPNVPMYVIINNNYSKPAVNASDVPSKVLVDYVRVYRKI